MAANFNGLLDNNGFSNAPVSSSERPVEMSQIRACTNCVRAKARCSTAIDAEGRCQRCHKMNKLCQPSPPVRRHRTAKRPSHHETSKLEAKLDDLVTLLKSNTRDMPVIINSSTNSISRATSRTANEEYRDSTSSTNRSWVNDTPTTPSPSNPSSLDSLVFQPTSKLRLEPSRQDAELFLNSFRRDFAKNVPFLSISPSITAYQLRQERPFLWISIMTVTSNNSTQQTLLSKEARGIFAKEVLVEGTRKIDLLLAILVYTFWDRCFYFGQSVLINLIQLAIGMLYNLGLDKPPSRDPTTVLAYNLKGTGDTARLSRAPTNEERRALLGCFLLSSVSCYTLRKGNTLQWTTYSDECLHALETEKEFDSDALLVQLVKLRLISARINDLPWSGNNHSANSAAGAPVSFYLKSLEAQLQSFKNNIPVELSNNETLLLELYTIERSIYEVGLSQMPGIFHGKENQRVECLWACTNATNSWINVFLSIPPGQYIGFSALTYSNMTHCFLSAYRLSTFDHAGWDRAKCIEHLDVLSLLDQAGKNFAQVKEAAGLVVSSEHADSFSMMASRIQVIKISWEKAYGCTGNSLVECSNAENHQLYESSMEFLDGDWLQDLLGSSYEQFQWAP